MSNPELHEEVEIETIHEVITIEDTKSPLLAQALEARMNDGWEVLGDIMMKGINFVAFMHRTREQPIRPALEAEIEAVLEAEAEAQAENKDVVVQEAVLEEDEVEAAAATQDKDEDAFAT